MTYHAILTASLFLRLAFGIDAAAVIGAAGRYRCAGRPAAPAHPA